MSPGKRLRLPSIWVLAALCVVAISITVIDPEPLIGQRFTAALNVAAPYQPDCRTNDESCRAWAEFRRGHPYPYQAIQWKRLGGGNLAILLLEPAPVMSRGELDRLIKIVFGEDLRSLRRLRWR